MVGGYTAYYEPIATPVEIYDPATNVWTAGAPLPPNTTFDSVTAFTAAAADTTPPTVSAQASKAELWPPNNKLTPVTVSGSIADDGPGPLTASYTVTDSYGQVQPSGTITVNANGSYAFTVQLMAARKGNDKAGRTYTITVTAKDAAGNTATASTGVRVPHSQGK